jgi:hypothetical protein
MAVNALNTLAKQYGPEALKEAFKLWTLCQEHDARTEVHALHFPNLLIYQNNCNIKDAQKELEEFFRSGKAPEAEAAKLEEPKLEEPKLEEPKLEEPKLEEPKPEVQAESTPSTPKRQITPEHKAKLRAGVLAAREAKKTAKAKEAMAVSEEEGLMAKTNIELVGIWASLTGRRSGLKQSKHHNKKEVVADIIRLRSDSEYRAAECARVKNKA